MTRSTPPATRSAYAKKKAQRWRVERHSPPLNGSRTVDHDTEIATAVPSCRIHHTGGHDSSGPKRCAQAPSMHKGRRAVGAKRRPVPASDAVHRSCWRRPAVPGSCSPRRTMTSRIRQSPVSDSLHPRSQRPRCSAPTTRKGCCPPSTPWSTTTATGRAAPIPRRPVFKWSIGRSGPQRERRTTQPL
jgi:hypothetical protein